MVVYIHQLDVPLHVQQGPQLPGGVLDHIRGFQEELVRLPFLDLGTEEDDCQVLLRLVFGDGDAQLIEQQQVGHPTIVAGGGQHLLQVLHRRGEVVLAGGREQPQVRRGVLQRVPGLLEVLVELRANGVEVHVTLQLRSGEDLFRFILPGEADKGPLLKILEDIRRQGKLQVVALLDGQLVDNDVTVLQLQVLQGFVDVQPLDHVCTDLLKHEQGQVGLTADEGVQEGQESRGLRGQAGRRVAHVADLAHLGVVQLEQQEDVLVRQGVERGGVVRHSPVRHTGSWGFDEEVDLVRLPVRGGMLHHVL
mmetsp:Transcript_40327/g.72066  ORF Transcript_40327/g.72066 Transcript_40327/m.72066 type:complete len:307 (+) Transcript_40327:728-1648(+)